MAKIPSLLIPIILLALILANLFVIQNQIISVVTGAVFLYYFGRRLGQVLFANFDKLFQLVFGVFSLISAAGILLWLAFYFYKINNLVFSAALIIAALTVEFCYFRFNRTAPKTLLNTIQTVKNIFSTITILPLIIIYLVLTAFNFYFLFSARTSDAIASPWNILAPHFFIIFFIATVFLILIICFNKNYLLSLSLIIVQALQMSSIALIVYKIGYGYDPFIHLAAMKHILAEGTLLPKTSYYIGEYSIIIFLTKLFGAGLEFINKALLPAAFSVLTPIVVYYSLSEGLNWQKRTSLFSALAILILPLTFFINTTPQGLTNLLALNIIFLSFMYRQNKIPIQFLFFLVFIALTIHPLYGAPLLVFVGYLFLRQLPMPRWLKISGLTVCGIIGAVIFPLLFFLNSIINKFSVNFSAPDNVSIPQLFFFKKQFNFLFDFLYLYGFNYQMIFIGLAIIGLVFICLHKKFRQFLDFAIIALILSINFCVVKYFLNFEFVTEQNKFDYLARIIELALYFLLPIFLYLVYALDERPRPTVQSAFLTLLLALLLSASLYFSYPVKDNYKNSHSFNVNQADIDTVQFIEQRTNGDYIVLANQMVGAAAIREFGFKKYYNGQFYYSIPTGGAAIYGYFEKMIFDKQAAEYAEKAMDAAGVKQAYFVVNDYWTNSSKIIEAAKKNSDGWFNIAGGRDTVFYYRR